MLLVHGCENVAGMSYVEAETKFTMPCASHFTGILSRLGAKLRDWAVRQVGAGCYSRVALSSNDLKTWFIRIRGHPLSASTKFSGFEITPPRPHEDRLKHLNMALGISSFSAMLFCLRFKLFLCDFRLGEETISYEVTISIQGPIFIHRGSVYSGN